MSEDTENEKSHRDHIPSIRKVISRLFFSSTTAANGPGTGDGDGNGDGRSNAAAAQFWRECPTLSSLYKGDAGDAEDADHGTGKGGELIDAQMLAIYLDDLVPTVSQRRKPTE